MPEGDTIRRLADRITARFAGERCVRCVTRDPRLVGVDLSGTVLVGADAIGKHLLVRFDDGRSLHAHLRMDGSFTVGPVAREPQWRRRVELWLESGRLTAVDVPVLEIVATAAESSVVGHLGPDLCGSEPPDLDEALARLTADPDRSLAETLLDQRVVAGFGNVYAVEIPFLFGVSPRQPVGATSGLADLLATGAALIRTNADRGPQNTTGRNLARADHWIYGRRHRPCPVCATTLAGFEEGESPWGRVSVWCPACQRVAPARAADAARARRLLALHPARRSPLFPADVRRVSAAGSPGTMSDAGAHMDDETADVASNAERIPTGDAAIAESARRVDALEQFESAEHRAAGEPSGTTDTDPTR